MSGTELVGRTVLVLERDDGRAGGLIVSLRALGAQAVRFSDDERGWAQARALAPEVVLVDAAQATSSARGALDTIRTDAAMLGASIVQTDAAALWPKGLEPSHDVLTTLVGSVRKRSERETKPLRAVQPPVIDTPKVVLAPSLSAQRIASRRATEKMGAVAAPPDQADAPTEDDAKGAGGRAAEPAEAAPVAAPSGYVFPSRARGDVEPEGSSKATSLDLTVVPSALLERANLPTTDRYPRPSPRAGWASWALAIAVVLALLAFLLAFVTR
jgi:hypothetical protein